MLSLPASPRWGYLGRCVVETDKLDCHWRCRQSRKVLVSVIAAIFARIMLRHTRARVFVRNRDGTSGELKYTLEKHSLGIHSVDTNHDGSRKNIYGVSVLTVNRVLYNVCRHSRRTLCFAGFNDLPLGSWKQRRACNIHQPWSFASLESQVQSRWKTFCFWIPLGRLERLQHRERR